MALDLATIKHVLGKDYDPKGDYIVSGNKDALRCELKGYTKLAEFDRGDEHHIIFDRRQKKKESKR